VSGQPYMKTFVLVLLAVLVLTHPVAALAAVIGIVAALTLIVARRCPGRATTAYVIWSLA
jgi:hypothetical protein